MLLIGGQIPHDLFLQEKFLQQLIELLMYGGIRSDSVYNFCPLASFKKCDFLYYLQVDTA